MAQTGPKVIVFVLILAIGTVVVRALLRLADRALEDNGFDRLLARSGIGRLLRCRDTMVRDGLFRLAAVAGLLAVLRVALGVFGPSPADRMAGAVLGVLVRLLLAIAIVLVGLALAGIARQFLTDSFSGLPHGRAVSRVVAAAACLLFGKAALDELGIGTSVTTPLLYAVLTAGTGVLVVGVGGGLIRPMQSRWEEILDRAEDAAEDARAAWRTSHSPAAPNTPPPSSTEQASPAGQAASASKASPVGQAASASQGSAAEQVRRETRPAPGPRPPVPRRPPIPPPGERPMPALPPRPSTATRRTADPRGPVPSADRTVPPPPTGTAPRSGQPAPPPTPPVRGDQPGL
ncbi:hypothetical protein CcI49_25365 [Frankia sp. CcI49]|nr:hypothetical protein ACG83_25390 [Frankia sp. R43]ONH57880.1 hypothetical protein CcI49_25365 [Frankia sp. CcI49]